MSQNQKVKIGRFEVLERLGEGFHGKLYLCWDPELKRRVALKLITQKNGEGENPQAVVNEALMAAKITHPNVIPIYEVGIQNNIPVLVFEYVEGMTLKEYMAEHGPFEQLEALSIMVRIAVGLQCAHDQNIVHLDLSPNNFMIDPQGRPRIMDFGLARLTASIEKEEMRDKVSGTPRYMSPEHISGGALCPASDIFTLGLVFYELITGTVAISKTSLLEVFVAVENATIDWGKIQYQGIAPEIIAILRDMLEVDTRRRYQSAAELVPDLDAAIKILESADSNTLALDFLLRRLQRRPEFPVCSQKITEINRLTDPNSDTHFNKIANVIMQDYALTNRIMKIANSAAFNCGAGKVTTVSQAISKLGLKLVRMVCNNLLMFSQIEDKNATLKDVLVFSFVSGLIAKQVSEKHNRRYAEEAFICALFHRLGHHLLAFYLTDEFNDMMKLVADGEPIIKAERAVLTTTSNALGAAIARKWNYSDSIINSMNTLPQGILEAPANEEEFLCHIASFADELCMLVDSELMDDKRQQAIDAFLERHSAFIKMDLIGLCELIAQALSDFRDLAHDLGVNYKKSVFCQRLEYFSQAEDSLSELEVKQA